MKQILAAVAVLALCVAAPAQALTVEDVVGLARADASDSIILSKIDADGTIFHLTVDDILRLKEAGVSDTVITYMINTGKNGEAAVQMEVEADPEAPQQSVPQDYDTSQGYGEAYGYASGSNSGFGVSFGYYYPHWPGYLYSYYYDPFYWGNRPYYWSGWAPYPYWGYYSWQPWYNYSYVDLYYTTCFRSYPRSYWHRGNYGGGYGYHDARKDGRHVGGRGTPAIDGRNTKSPRGGSSSSFADAVEGVKTRYRQPSNPGVSIGRKVMKPTQPGDGHRLKPPSVTPGRGGTPVRPGYKQPAAPPSRGNKVSPAPDRTPSKPPRVVERPRTPRPPQKATPPPPRSGSGKAPASRGGGKSTGRTSKSGKGGR